MWLPKKYYSNYDCLKIDIDDLEIQSDIYNQFYNEVGAIIVKNAYKKNIMDLYNQWCENNLEVAKKDNNCKHPKQKISF